MTRYLLVLACNLFLFQLSAQPVEVPVWGNWKQWGDQGNGTYRNPVLPGDYSDLDCIRVGDDYYAVSSTFQFSPGFVVLHSKDLVNWKILAHAVNDITAISPEMNWDRMNCYGRGIWAGAIRYHDKKFWIYFGDPEKGYFMTTAKSPEGPWEPLHQVMAEKGWDDCCPFWDDDGQGYFIGTHFADGYKIHLFKMTPDGKTLIRDSDQVIYQSKGSEANKLFKIGDTYYHFFSEVKPDGRAVMMQRSKNLYGPYEVKQLSHAQQEWREPNQGGIVQTKAGDWYFLTHHGSGDWSGRIMSLLPVNWVNGWPILGTVGPDTIGRMVWSGKMPVKGQKRRTPQTDDDFGRKTLSPQWEWNYQPRSGKWSLTERKGWLRLHAFKPLAANDFFKAGNTLTQRAYRTERSEVVVKMDISRMAEGQKAGLAHFGYPKYAAVQVSCNAEGKTLNYVVDGVAAPGPALKENIIWLRSTWGLDGINTFSYSSDGKNFTPIGQPWQLVWGAYRGDRIALFNYNDDADAGMIDIDAFSYQYTASEKE